MKINKKLFLNTYLEFLGEKIDRLSKKHTEYSKNIIRTETQEIKISKPKVKRNQKEEKEEKQIGEKNIDQRKKIIRFLENAYLTVVSANETLNKPYRLSLLDDTLGEELQNICSRKKQQFEVKVLPDSEYNKYVSQLKNILVTKFHITESEIENKDVNALLDIYNKQKSKDSLSIFNRTSIIEVISLITDEDKKELDKKKTSELLNILINLKIKNIKNERYELYMDRLKLHYLTNRFNSILKVPNTSKIEVYLLHRNNTSEDDKKFIDNYALINNDNIHVKFLKSKLGGNIYSANINFYKSMRTITLPENIKIAFVVENKEQILYYIQQEQLKLVRFNKFDIVKTRDINALEEFKKEITKNIPDVVDEKSFNTAVKYLQNIFMSISDSEVYVNVDFFINIIQTMTPLVKFKTDELFKKVSEICAVLTLNRLNIFKTNIIKNRYTPAYIAIMDIETLFPEMSEYDKEFDAYFKTLVKLHEDHLKYTFSLGAFTKPIIDVEEEPEGKHCGKSFEDIVYYKCENKINCILVSEAMEIVRQGGNDPNTGKPFTKEFLERYRILYRDIDNQVYDFSYIEVKDYINNKIKELGVSLINYQNLKNINITNLQSGKPFKPEFLYSILNNLIIVNSGIEKEYFSKPYSKIFVENCENFQDIVGINDADILIIEKNNKKYCYPVDEVIQNIGNNIYGNDIEEKIKKLYNIS
jgi:hypothetical protein